MKSLRTSLQAVLHGAKAFWVFWQILPTFGKPKVKHFHEFPIFQPEKIVVHIVKKYTHI